MRWYFVEDYLVALTSGTVARGMAQLEALVEGGMAAFPDICIQILDYFCFGDKLRRLKLWRLELQHHELQH